MTSIGFQLSGDFHSYCLAIVLASPVAQPVLSSVRAENIREEIVCLAWDIILGQRIDSGQYMIYDSTNVFLT